MRIPAAALTQPQSETDSLASGGTSRGGHDGNFAQMFRKSLGKSPGTSSAPSPSTTQETRTAGASLPVQLHRADAAQPEAPAASPPQASLSPGTLKAEASSPSAAVLSGSGTGGTPRTRASNPAATATTTTTTATSCLGHSGSDSTPFLLSHASRPPAVDSYQAGNSARTAPAAQTAAQPSATAIYRSAGDLCALGSEDTNAGVTITTSATASERLIVVQRETSSPASSFGGFGTDNSPHLSVRVSGAPLAAAIGSGEMQPFAQTAVDSKPATATAPGPIAAHRLAQIVVDSKPATTTAATTPAASATKSPFGGSRSDNTPHPPTTTAPLVSAATTAAADLAPLAAHATQPAKLAASALPSLEPAAQDDFAASKEVLPAAARAASRSAKPAQTVPPLAAPTTTVNAQPATDAKPPTGPVVQPWSEARDRISTVSADERKRAQDSTDDPSPESTPALAILAAAPNPTAPFSHTHSPHSTQGTAVPEHPHAPAISEGKPTTDHAEPPSPAPAPTAAQAAPNGLHADAQMAATLQQAMSQAAPPVHAPATLGTASAAATDLRAAVHLPADAAPLAALAGRDDGLSMTVHPHAAHMAIESPDGDLDLHMRVRQGSADITVGGSMAHLFDTRAPEARAALAGEGLALGRFDSGQQGGGQQNQPAPEAPEAASEPPAAYRPHQTAPVPAAPSDGRIHVTA